MVKILSIKYRREKVLFAETPANLYVRKDKIDSFILYHRHLASEMFGEGVSVMIDHRERPEKDVSAINTMNLIAEKLGIDPSLMLGSGSRDILEARQMAMKICNEDLDMSPVEIERETNISHDLQWHSRKTIQGLIDSYPRYEEQYNDIRDYVLAKIFDNYEKQQAEAVR